MDVASKPVQTPPVRPRPGHLAGLDGLRAIAVIAVIVFHAFPAILPGGFVGVDLFFVISGFLITGLLLRERSTTGRISLPAFWARRARRLLPALILVVTICSSVALVIGGDVLVGLGSQVFGAGTFSSNWFFIAQGTDYFDASNPELFRNLWSLAVEEQFYLLWPLSTLLIVLLRSRAARAGVATAMAVASVAAMALLSTDATRAYYGTDTHSFGLTLGAALAFLVQGRFTATGDERMPSLASRILLPVPGLLALGGVVAIAILLPEDAALATRGGLAVVALLTVAVIATATRRGSWLGRVLDLAPVRWIGARSYGLYLWHWPALVLLGALPPLRNPGWLVPVLAIVVTVAAAAVSYRFVEVPLRGNGVRGSFRKLRVRPRRFALGAAVSVVALIAATGFTGVAIAVAPDSTEAESVVTQGRESVDRPTPPPRASDAPPALPTGDQMLAVGDSVMLAAAPELQAAFPGISIDAVVSRQMFQAEDLVAAIRAAGALRPILVLGLGTNGPIDEDTLEAVHDEIGPDTRMIVVNVQAPRDWVPGVNTTLDDFARGKRDVQLCNWFGAIQPSLDMLASDEVHPGEAGGRIYVKALQGALQQLAETPPLLAGNQYGLAARPE